MTDKLKIVCISDTHDLHRRLVMPPGDILIHAGDWTVMGKNLNHARDFLNWLEDQPYAHKLLIAGNHEMLMEKPATRRQVLDYCLSRGITYLEDSGITIHGINFWGSPWQPECGGLAFNLVEDEELAAKWTLIPQNTHVLICHTPPAGICDLIPDIPPRNAGCRALSDRISELPYLRTLVCGHIHEGRGIDFDERGRAIINATSVGRQKGGVLEPILFEL